eukprot:TRINITY_DN1443_c0_g1_i1.p1 TRINITY_DN1443_c0_g1~~TRINITY_DN1443_c0_g1_i1.p1  ORF type:complete len:408 (-),score=90.34 TRINITY_DN1443_c0_g1_i1:487-1710(-)
MNSHLVFLLAKAGTTKRMSSVVALHKSVSTSTLSEEGNGGGRKKLLLSKSSASNRRVVIPTPSNTWIPDSDRTHCLNCSCEFTMFTRKHHCRRCGDIFCRQCIAIDADSKQKVCVTCSAILEAQEQVKRLPQQQQFIQKKKEEAEDEPSAMTVEEVKSESRSASLSRDSNSEKSSSLFSRLHKKSKSKSPSREIRDEQKYCYVSDRPEPERYLETRRLEEIERRRRIAEIQKLQADCSAETEMYRLEAWNLSRQAENQARMEAAIDEKLNIEQEDFCRRERVKFAINESHKERLFRIARDNKFRRRMSNSENWVPDEERKFCSGCGLEFTLVRRRHHCRKCGEVFCKLCCPKDKEEDNLNAVGNTSGAEAEGKKVKRVCGSCGEYLKGVAAKNRFLKLVQVTFPLIE